MSEERIYHLVPESEFGAGLRGDRYAPARFSEDGFIHCAAGAPTVLAVAGDYYSDLREPLLVVEIDPSRLESAVVYEAPAPIEGGGTAHLETATSFPHIYGPVILESITGIARLGEGNGRFSWPARFGSLADYLSAR